MANRKKIISFFFIVLFTSYYASTSLFSHIHIINGATITHSHIHTDAHHNTKNGGHNGHSITLIAQISQLAYLDFSCYDVPNPLEFLLYKNNFTATTHWVPSVYFQNLSLRAPPIIL